jgi:4-hydroxythreonine-4-phosphate dehydrogenase
MRPILGITMGDPAGVGPEITVKSLADAALYVCCRPVVFGDMAAIADAVAFTGSNLRIRPVASAREAPGEYGTIDLVDAGLLAPGGWQYGKVDAACGEAAYQYIERAIHAAMRKEIAGVVTGPINKEALNRSGHHYSGHTEIFADLTGSKHYAMVLSTDTLRVIHVTTHVPLRDACDRLTRDRVLEVIRLAQEACKLFGIASPRIAVAGLNPHCSENGLFGHEEAESIEPAVQAAKAEGICAEGPLPPDSVFVRAVAGKFDIVVAMYHDQGHIPLKLTGFRLDPKTGAYTAMGGVNSTVGLPIIRTSVDHGTAFDRAGKNLANPQSMTDAIRLAVQMAHVRAERNAECR